MSIQTVQAILGTLISLFVIGLYVWIAAPKDEDYLKKILRIIVPILFLLILVTLGTIVF